MEDVEIVKEYHPKPKNPDGSVRRYLYRWDDGKDGVRRLARCRLCGRTFLIQSYHLSQIADPEGILYEDWYDIDSEEEADLVNDAMTGLQYELRYKPILRFADGKPIN
ncbi:MAG: hypothetical protein ACI3YK_06505 [Eubacteriales bacterium]